MVQFYVGDTEPFEDTGNAKWVYFHLSDGEIVVPAGYDYGRLFMMIGHV
ncbi:MAG TPA: hypothetical protein VFC84_02250 [Desulfosporosinus sp.]|nr:hypothetical protein [Desulfosporosinus sp.]